MEFYSLEPWGFDVTDAHFGMLAATVAAGAGAQDVKPSDFMLGTNLEARQESESEQLLKFLQGKLRPAGSTG